MYDRPVDKKVVKDDAYAQSLLRQVNAEFEAKQTRKPQVKHVLSKNTLIYIAVSIGLTIVATLIVSYFSKR